MFWLYNALLTLFSPIWVPWMLWRANRRKEKVNWKERTGEYRFQLRKGSQRVWFHAVSVGEVVAALPILRELRNLSPESEIVLSVTTSSGHATATQQAADLVDHIVYFPIDVPRFCLGAMAKVRPAVVAIMETELWFNFLWAAKAVGAKTLLLNGRISDRSYPRSRALKFFYGPLLSELDGALMQSERDRERIMSLGARDASVYGNCKFDQLSDEDVDPAAIRAELNLDPDLPVLVIGSTRGSAEEQFVIQALQAPLLTKIQVIHAPRHLETADSLAEEASRAFPGQVARRSRQETGRYLILDTYGELAKTYAVADIAVVGGGFANLGGQNIIQPLAWGKPVIHGPHMANFRDVAEMAQTAGASVIVDTPAKLGDALAKLLADPDRRNSMGLAARTLVQQNRGASARYATAIADALPPP